MCTPPLRVAAAILVLTAVSLTGACRDPDQTLDVAIGTPRPVASRLPVIPTGNQIVPAAHWPSACHLVADSEITSLLPQATDITRYPRPVDVIAVPGIHQDSITDVSPSSTAPEGSCAYSFWLRHAAIQNADSELVVTIDAVAGHALITRRYTEALASDQANHHRQVTDHDHDAGPDACYSYLDTGNPPLPGAQAVIVCRQGPIMWEMTGYGIGAFTGVSTTLDAQRDHWRDAVLLPATTFVAAKASRA